MSLADYLAKNYLNTSEDGEKKKKKRKSKRKESSSTPLQPDAVTVFDDVTGWEGQDPLKEEEEDPEDDIIQDTTSGNSKAGWKKVGAEESSSSLQPPVMESGAKAGLQTAEQVEADIKRKEAEELRKLKKEQESSGKGSETVYRDASGRRVDIHSQIEESRQKAERDQEEKSRRKKELNKGLVQQADAEKQNEELKKMKDTSLARYEDDKELNEQQKLNEQFDDPAAKFLTKKSRSKQNREKGSSTGMKIYQGHYAPNRFNIPPGYLWDGVDRSNGFESRWFEKQNERKEKQALTYQMSYDI